jgi:6-phosphogluconolactonase
VTRTGPDILVASDAAALARTAADLLVAWCAAAVGRREAANVALTGGSSARALYRALREPDRQSALPWERVHLWWGDERFVPTQSPDCNAGLAMRELLATGGPPVPLGTIHRVPVDAALAAGRPPTWAAETYAAEVRSSVPPAQDGDLPAFDVILLGVGSDGHVLSVFPGSPALAAGAPLAMAIDAPTHIAPHLPRVTLAPALLAAARHVLVMVPGAAKATVVREVLTGPRDPERLPAQLALGLNAAWLLDRDSAARLTPGV